MGLGGRAKERPGVVRGLPGGEGGRRRFGRALTRCRWEGKRPQHTA